LGLRLIRTWSELLGFGHMAPAVYGRDDANAVLREAAVEMGLAVDSERSSTERDPWAISLSNAVERTRAAFPSVSVQLDPEFASDAFTSLSLVHAPPLSEKLKTCPSGRSADTADGDRIVRYRSYIDRQCEPSATACVGETAREL